MPLSDTATARPVALQCRVCNAVGAVVDEADGQSAVAQLPRCSCFLRSHKGKLPDKLAALLADAPPVAAPEAGARVVSEPRAQRAPPPAPDPSSRRPVYSTENLPATREVMVYDTMCSDEALLGSVVVGAGHTLRDVLEMLRDELDVKLPVALYRGTFGGGFRVPLPPGQHSKVAMHFFPTEQQHLLVEALEDL